MIASLPDDLQRALGARYRIERELGGGGMSRVFVAEEQALGRKVVIKILPRELVADLSMERFRREIHLAAQLQHPHIVPVLATGDADGLPWFTMPFVTGESLRIRLQRERLLPLRDAISILRDIASALECAHAQSVVHRDIKPENVLLTGRAALVTDFGIAKALTVSRTTASAGTLTEVGTALGTPAYMAPEQAAGDPGTDLRADIYAWGGIAFEVLGGRPPFVGASNHALVRAHMIETPVRLDTLRSDLPATLVALVARCLEKRPEDRPASAAELLRTLEAIPLLGNATVHVSALPGDSARGRPPRSLRPVLIGALALAAAVAGALAWRRTTTATEAATVAPVAPDFDPALVLLAPISTDDASLNPAASIVTDALSRVLGTLRYAQATIGADSATDRRAEAVAGRMPVILDGRLYALGDSVQLDLRLTSAATGRIIRALPTVRVSRADPSRGLEAALTPTMSAVAIVTNPLLGPELLPAGSLPALPAVRAFEAAVLQREYPKLVGGLNEAVRLDTSWALSRIVRAYSYLSYSAFLSYLSSYQDDQSREAVLAALPGPSAVLTPYEAALRDAALAVSEAAPERELAALRRVQRAAPGAYASRFYIAVLEDRNRPREALAQMELVGPFVRDPEALANTPLVESAYHWLRKADLLHYVGDHQRERAAAEHFEKLAGVNISSLTRRGVAYAALGDSAAVELVVTAAEVANSESIPNGFGGEVLLIMSQELSAHGHPAHGQQVLERALRWFDQHLQDPLPGDSVPRLDLALRKALALRVAGRNAEALAAVRPLVAADVSDPRYRSFYGRVQAALGNTAAADSVDAWLTEMQRDPVKARVALNERAFLAAARGRRDEAVALLREAFARGNAFYIRRNLHRFNDWTPFKGYAPFDALITPEG